MILLVSGKHKTLYGVVIYVPGTALGLSSEQSELSLHEEMRLDLSDLETHRGKS